MSYPAEFYDAVRPLFGGLAQTQVDGLNLIVDEGRKRGVPKPELAYILATTYHETAHTMQPIRERGGEAYFRRMYDIGGSRPHVAKRLGNTEKGDGVKFCGRGFVQITGRSNYTKFARRYGEPLVDDPAQCMRPDIAVRILFDGMLEGVFTGKALGKYINATKIDYRNARRVVNGTDRAAMIAGYAMRFAEALEHVDMSVVSSALPPPERGFLDILIELFLRIFGGRK